MRPSGPVLLIGGGQLGGAVASFLGEGISWQCRVPWGDHSASLAVLREAVRVHLGRFGPEGSIAWCAGVGIVGSAEGVLQLERELLSVVVETASTGTITPARFMLASSAGGVYGGNRGTCDELTPPLPTSHYGQSKLLQEHLVADAFRSRDTSVLVARISNLYGPRQDLRKPQGFVTAVIRAAFSRQPLVYRVPAGTIRDFVYADAVGRRIAGWLLAPASERSGTVVKLLAAERSISLAHLVQIVMRVTRRPLRVLFAAGHDSDQPSTLRFRSAVDAPGLGPPIGPGLEHGIQLTAERLVSRMIAGRL